MFQPRAFVRCAIVMLSLFTLVAATPAWFHTTLTKSEPAANDTLAAAPHMLRLWFSERVELPLTRVKLADAAGQPVPLAPLARPDTGARAPILVAITKPVSAGRYVVSWSTAADDGHPAKGTFAFVVKAAR